MPPPFRLALNPHHQRKRSGSASTLHLARSGGRSSASNASNASQSGLSDDEDGLRPPIPLSARKPSLSFTPIVRAPPPAPALGSSSSSSFPASTSANASGSGSAPDPTPAPVPAESIEGTSPTLVDTDADGNDNDNPNDNGIFPPPLSPADPDRLQAHYYGYARSERSSTDSRGAVDTAAWAAASALPSYAPDGSLRESLRESLTLQRMHSLTRSRSQSFGHIHVPTRGRRPSAASMGASISGGAGLPPQVEEQEEPLLRSGQRVQFADEAAIEVFETDLEDVFEKPRGRELIAITTSFAVLVFLALAAGLTTIFNWVL